MKDLYQAYLNSTTICTDTRNITSGCIFFALKGENFNGNTYASEALKKGAAYAVIDEAQFHLSNGTILVDDVLTSLQEMARHHRHTLTIPIIGLTGSNGKTTTKELIAAALKTKYNVFATAGNLNNHIGVPLSILSISNKHEIAIIEMGANHLKEIAFLVNIAQPSHGLITNIGRAHLEGFGSPEGIIKGKRELYDFLSNSNGTLFLNQSDDLLVSIAPEVNTLSYGENALVSGVITSDQTLLELCVTVDGKDIQIKSNLVGGYNLSNILAAFAIAYEFGVAPEQIKSGLENYSPTNNRSQFITTDSNQVIMDAYNANPSSVEAALINFAKREESAKTVILGDMRELGSASKAEHLAIISLIKSLQLEAYLVGEEFSSIDQSDFKSFPNADSVSSFLKTLPLSNYTILVKGSRGIKLETILEFL
jgi:UDP-N-acetylmuramoyl-tripeptide--D-alanyl-D-alanine ligase